MGDMTLLTYEQLYTDKKLEVFKKYGRKCRATDFAILLGADIGFCSYINEDKSLKNRAGSYWLKTQQCNSSYEKYSDRWYYQISAYGSLDFNLSADRRALIRPVLPYNKVSFPSMNFKVGSYGTNIVEYGEYPQWIAPKRVSKKLESKYKKKSLKITGNSYTTDFGSNPNSNKFCPRHYTEYEYNGKRYVRFKGNPDGVWKELSNGNVIKLNKPYWIEVTPIEWLLDKDTDLLISKDGLISGIPIDYDYGIKFEDSDLKQFLDRYFSVEIFQNYKKVSNHSNLESLTKKNEIIDLLCDMCLNTYSASKTYLESKKALVNSYLNLKESLEKYVKTNDNETLFQENESIEEIIELLNKTIKIEETVDKKYFEYKNETKDMYNSLDRIFNQTNEVSDEQIKDIKERIKRL